MTAVQIIFVVLTIFGRRLNLDLSLLLFRRSSNPFRVVFLLCFLLDMYAESLSKIEL